jgi:hypothetical protein
MVAVQDRYPERREENVIKRLELGKSKNGKRGQQSKKWIKETPTRSIAKVVPQVKREQIPNR